MWFSLKSNKYRVARKEWHSYQNCHEKRYLDVCGWVGRWVFYLDASSVATWHFLKSKTNRLFFMLSLVKIDLSKIQKTIFCFVFSFPLVSQYWSYVFVFNIPYFSIAQYLENVCIQRSQSLVKNSYTYTKDVYE